MTSNTRISRQLFWALRHGAEGFVSLKELLQHERFRGLNITEAQVQQVVCKCPKNRFALETRGAQLFIRANFIKA